MSKNIIETNRSFMHHQTIVKIRKIGSATYIVESVFANTGPTVEECIENKVKSQIGVKESEKDTYSF